MNKRIEIEQTNNGFSVTSITPAVGLERYVFTNINDLTEWLRNEKFTFGRENTKPNSDSSAIVGGIDEIVNKLNKEKIVPFDLNKLDDPTGIFNRKIDNWLKFGKFSEEEDNKAKDENENPVIIAHDSGGTINKNDNYWIKYSSFLKDGVLDIEKIIKECEKMSNKKDVTYEGSVIGKDIILERVKFDNIQELNSEDSPIKEIYPDW